jgi:RNA polymerase sigma-70 factor, ECF subfamily
MVERSDASLIEASLADPDRFGEIFDRHMPEIRRYLHRRVGSAAGDDLTSETFAIAFRGRDRFDLARPDARPWLFGIAANVIRNHKRSEKRQARAYARTSPELEEGLDLHAVHDRLDAGSLGPQVYEALSGLRAGERELILLNAWAELSHGEISEALGIPVGTVKSRLSRAEKKVRDAIGSGSPAVGRSGVAQRSEEG